MITAVVLAFVGDLEEKIKSPLLDSLENYDPESNSNSDEALVNAWDDFQREVFLILLEHFKKMLYLNVNLFSLSVAVLTRGGIGRSTTNTTTTTTSRRCQSRAATQQRTRWVKDRLHNWKSLIN